MLGQPGVNQWSTIWEVSLTQRQIPSRPGNERIWHETEWKVAFSYNCVGLFELKAPALHSTRWEGHMQNLTIQPMASPPALALFSVWACCRCRRQDQWELAVCYLPLSWEICWECRSRSYCSPERILSQIFFQLCCGSDTCGFVSQLLTVHTAPFTPFAVQWVGLLILKIRHLMYICVVCYN